MLFNIKSDTSQPSEKLFCLNDTLNDDINTIYKSDTSKYSNSHSLNNTLHAQSHTGEVHCSSPDYR